jgi:predicted nucleic acid-binding protein
VKYSFDTNIYVEASKSESTRARFRSVFFPLLPATFLSAVVAHELFLNARDRETEELVRELVRPMERTGRLVTPDFDDWMEAARVLSAVWERDRPWRSKLPRLLNDVLIALCARRVGATLVTYNRADFQLIRRHLPFALRVLDET